MALGLAIPPAFRALPGADEHGWTFAALFLAILVLLRVFPAVLRHTLPFSVEATAIWAERRNIAKRYDSYQFQKLFWFGLGLLPYAAIGGGLRNGELTVTLICLTCGGAGLLLWQRTAALRLQ